MNRREFLTAFGGTVLAAGACTLGTALLIAPRARLAGAKGAKTAKRWGMVIDLNKCVEGCTECMKACREENNVAFHGDPRWDIHWIRKVRLKRKGSDSPGKEMILLCNHCDHPPCAQVCPVQATYKRHDGVVLVDQHRCIGCRYCVMSCPYNARYFNFKEHPGHHDPEKWHNKDYPIRSHGVAESCNLCVHLLDRDEDAEPACVRKCREIGVNAIAVGDLEDPEGHEDPEKNVHELIAKHSPKRLREDLHTEPKVYYIGL